MKHFPKLMTNSVTAIYYMYVVFFFFFQKKTTWSNAGALNISLDDFSLSSKYQKTTQPSMNQMATQGSVGKCISHNTCSRGFQCSTLNRVWYRKSFFVSISSNSPLFTILKAIAKVPTCAFSVAWKDTVSLEWGNSLQTSLLPMA